MSPLLRETVNSTQESFTSRYTPNVDEVFDSAFDYLGNDFVQLDRGVFRSVDGLRGFRIDENSIKGLHNPHKPHIHFEIYDKLNNLLINNHVPYVE